jgi:REP element-mobilizing transposase RayT
MPRRPRIDFPGAWHHVTHRGARREPIFLAEDHCLLFLECLEPAAVRHGCEIHAYALMPNHYHLLVRSVEGRLSKCMQYLNGRYTQRLNRRHGWDGPVFRGRYHSQRVDSDEYRRAVAAYIHLNPVRAGLVNRPEAAPYSSYAQYIGLHLSLPFLHRHEIVALHGTLPRLIDYVRNLQRGAATWPEELDLETGRILGWEAPSPEQADFHRVGERPAVDDLLAAVCEVTGQPRSSLRKARGGRRGNPGRRLAAWALVSLGALSFRAAGERLGMRPEATQDTVGRLRRGLPPEPFRGWIRALEARFAPPAE